MVGGTEVNVSALQTRLGVKPDGKWGLISRQALLNHFTNLIAPAVSVVDIQAYAIRLGCSVEQINAVAKVESSGGGFDKSGRPKILFERHWFHRRIGKTIQSQSVAGAQISAPKSGGYTVDADNDGVNDSWEKLADACGIDPDAAFASASWGKFQVMGGHWKALGYPSAYSMAWTAAQSEADHYEMLARYIETFGLKGPLRAISRDPETCRAFARGYNGPAYARNNYHSKLARAMT